VKKLRSEFQPAQPTSSTNISIVFRANEVPFVIDILSDFGKFPADLQAGFNAIPNFNDQVIATNNFIAVVAECYVYARQKDFEMPYLG